MRYFGGGRTRRCAGGFSLVELMVAVVIGLIGSIVIFQVFGIFEGQKRTTTSAGDAQQNGMLALIALERDARAAGYGLNFLPLVGCSVIGHDTAGGRDLQFYLVAARIDEGAANAPDTLTFVQGGANIYVLPTKLVLAAGMGTDNVRIESTYGYRAGDLVLLGQVSAPLPECNLRHLTAVPPATGDAQLLEHAAGARYNRPGGITVSYAVWDTTSQTGGRLLNLGAAPPAAEAASVGIYTVANGRLMYQNLIAEATATPIVEGIVQLQAQYGLDVNGNGAIEGDEWRDGCPAPAVAGDAPQLRLGPAPGACATPSPADWTRVIAVRMAVVVRSVQPERPDLASGLCNTTTAFPSWSGGTLDLGADPEWRCYRYRVFETTVALRNFIWFPL